MGKLFLTYSQQIDQLQNNKNILCANDKDKENLVKIGYFNLINGYKAPFIADKDCNGNHIYMTGVSLRDFLYVKEFDDELRYILFKYITKLEGEIRSIVSYVFDYHNSRGNIPWTEINAYDSERNGRMNITILISKLANEVKLSRSEYFKHFLREHDMMPTWVLFKGIKFSEFLDVVKASKVVVKDTLCSLYGIKNDRGYSDYTMLEGSLQWLRKIRNTCAHNERVFDITMNGRIPSKYISLLPRSYQVRLGANKTLLDLLVYLRYYLCDEEYSILISEMQRILASLKTKINKQAFDFIRGKMGIKDISHLSILKETSKPINYLDFINGFKTK